MQPIGSTGCCRRGNARPVVASARGLQCAVRLHNPSLTGPFETGRLRDGCPAFITSGARSLKGRLAFTLCYKREFGYPNKDKV